MKRIILSLGVCSIMMLISSCSGELEIPDANFKAYLLENFDKNKDGNISLSEAKAIKEINCSGKNIEKLDGIEKFESLESLDCSNNKLEELEIRYNLKLNKLVCNGNNEGMTIYIGMKSPLRNQAIVKPKANEQPDLKNVKNNILNDSKCTYDKNTTRIVISFVD
jgi:Leucine-rich repeat (LRR) protein